MTSTYLIDGAALDDPEGRWFLDHSTLLPAVPARNVARLELPNRSRVVAKRQGWGEASLQVAVNVLSWVDVPVVQAVLARAGTVVKQVVGSPTVSAEILESQVSDPSRVAVDAWRLEASLTLQPFWVEVGAPVLSAAKTPPGALVFAEWAGSTGDLVDGILRVKGPLTELQVIGSDGTGASLKTAVSSTQYLFINVATFQAWLSTSATAWTPSTTRVLLDYPAAGPLRLTPEADGTHLTVSGVGFGTGTEVRLRGKRWWL